MEKETHISLLGKPVKDRVTGFAGVVSSVSFDLYGCVQAVVTPPVNEKGETQSGSWFDATRLEILSEIPVMTPPDFSAGYIAEGKKGCATKTLPNT